MKDRRRTEVSNRKNERTKSRTRFGTDIYDRVISTLQPGSYCSKEELEILLLQLVGGTSKKSPSGVITKENIHILFVDQPMLKILLAKNLVKLCRKWNVKNMAKHHVSRHIGIERRAPNARSRLNALEGITVVENLDFSLGSTALREMAESNTSMLVITDSGGGSWYRREETREEIGNALEWCDTVLANEKTPEKRAELVDQMLQTYNFPNLSGSVDRTLPKNNRMSSSPLTPAAIKKYIAKAQSICPSIAPDPLIDIKEHYLKICAENKWVTEQYASSAMKFAEASAKAHFRIKVTEDDVGRALRLMDYWVNKFSAVKENWDSEEDEYRDRRRGRSKLFTIATPKYTLDDVILSERNKRQIEECLAELKNKSLIYEQWGFSSTIKRSKGIVMLFTGAPGTGKTMTAEALAKHLGKELLVVNYAQLESCWVGETEKNIERAFKEAKDKNAILLFDEADTMLGSRDLGFRHPYHIKVVNNMLEKIEKFDGILILATNLSPILDTALERRIDIAIQFDFPDADMCEKIYRKMIPDKAPIAKDVGFKELAKKYPLAGGKILNVVKSAVRSAVFRESKEITMEDFERAAKVEYERPAMLQRSCMSKPANGKHASLDEDVPKYA